jgi:DNA-binding MarR family transcriptional regulator
MKGAMASNEQEELREVATRLHAAAIRLLRTLRKEDDGTGLSAPRLSALSVVAFAGPLSLAELAAAEQVRPPTMSRIVDALVEAGLVTRERAPDNRRSVRIAATARGVRLMNEGRKKRIRALVERLDRLAEDDRRLLARAAGILEQVAR